MRAPQRPWCSLGVAPRAIQEGAVELYMSGCCISGGWGTDYPRDWYEFSFSFPDDDACRDYLDWLRWADGFVCPNAAAGAAVWRRRRAGWS